MLKKCQGSPISTLMGKVDSQDCSRNCASVSQMHASSMPTAQRKQPVALSAVAVTDEMLATLKRLPIGYTKKILQPSSLMRQVTNCRMVSKVRSSYQAQLFQKVI